MEWEEPDGRPRPFPSTAPYRCLMPTWLMLILLEVVRMFVMRGSVELFMMKEMKMISLSGPGQTQISKRYRAQCSKADAVRRTLSSSEGNG